MKLSSVAVFAVSASLVGAYTASDIPSCAIPCFDTGAPQVGCAVTDTACQCAKSSELTDKITGCVTSSCSSQDALKTQEVSTGICKQLSSSASSAAATSTSTASSAGSSAASNMTVSVTAATTATATVTQSKTADNSGSSSGSSGSGTASATDSAETANTAGALSIGEASIGLVVMLGMLAL